VTITGTAEVAVVSSQATPPDPVSFAQPEAAPLSASASAQAVLPVVQATEPTGPAPRQLGAIPLGLPVDGAVPAWNFAGQSTSAAVQWPEGTFTRVDAASAPGAPGFPVVRIPAAQAGILRVGDLDDVAELTSGGQRLFVYRGIPGMQLLDGGNSLSVPPDAFAHTDPQAIVILEARLANGAPLPAWLRFEGISGRFVGVPPEDAQGATEVEVIARDTEGREAHAVFTLEIGALGGDVDKKEAEKARLEAAREAQQRAPSFSEQVRAAKAKDPLLERIARARTER
jgi:hypothetical protein